MSRALGAKLDWARALESTRVIVRVYGQGVFAWGAIGVVPFGALPLCSVP